MGKLQSLLKEHWGYTDFREKQEEIITSVLLGKDTLALLPTGGGKSLCYQLPALVMEGTALVVSPLLALMKEQVSDLNARGISAACLSSELDPDREEQIYSCLLDDAIKILYVSPERLINKKFLHYASEIHWSFIAVDEAHCISQWGSDFRPSYHNIDEFRQLIPGLPCLAVTATASEKVIKEIEKELSLQKPAIYQNSYRRENLWIQVLEIADKYAHILYFLESHKGAGLIYVRTRREAEDLAGWLQFKGFKKRVAFYHAGLATKVKHKIQNEWSQSPEAVLVCTNAFGMGIDKPDVSFVLHLGPPMSIENYYQEIGRAGRDGRKTQEVLLWNESELTHYDELLKSSFVDKKQYLQGVSAVYSGCGVADGFLPEGMFSIDLPRAQRTSGCNRSQLKAILQFMANQELIYLNQGRSRSLLALEFELRDLESLSQKDAYFLELLSRAVPGLSQRETVFGEKATAEKIGVKESELKFRLKELQKKNLVRYTDGSSFGIRFLEPRNQRLLEGLHWKTLSTIQRNKLQKWEEMKFFLREKEFCRTRMILKYFGENLKKDCGHCDYCLKARTPQRSHKMYRKVIFEQLMKKPMSLDEMVVYLKYYPKTEVLDQLKTLLDEGQIKMLDYKTYSL